MDNQWYAIESTGVVDDGGTLHLDRPLPLAGPKRVRVVVLYSGEREGISDSRCDPDVRLYDTLGEAHLQLIQNYAEEELRRFLLLSGNPVGRYAIYKDRLVAICLCQGAALHFIDGTTGVKDIDVWFFFRDDDRQHIRNVGNMRYSINAKVGSFGLRKLDFLKKGISKKVTEQLDSDDPADVVTAYLLHAGTDSANWLRQKAVVGLYPKSIFGQVIWPKLPDQ